MLAILPDDSDDAPEVDHFVFLRDVSWADYERLRDMRGDHSAPRISYLEGTVEIMSPSRSHESIKSRIGCLVEIWCLERGIEFNPYGSWTIAKQAERRGVEPDECYVFGEVADPKRPDLAIEVIWTSGGLDKPDIYRKLGVREIWFWKRGHLTAHGLRGDNYVELKASKVLPGIDLAELAGFIGKQTTSQAMRAYRARLQARAR